MLLFFIEHPVVCTIGKVSEDRKRPCSPPLMAIKTNKGCRVACTCLIHSITQTAVFETHLLELPSDKMHSLLMLCQFVLFGAAVVSLIVYFLSLIVLVKNRKVEPLNAPFFKLCISLGIADIGADYGPLLLHPKWGRLFGLYLIIPAFFLFIAQYLGVAAIAANRYCNMVYLHKEVWTPRVHMLALIIQWLVPTIFCVPAVLFTAPSVAILNQSDSVFVDLGHANPFQMTLLFIICVISTIVMSVLYTRIYATMRKIRKDSMLAETKKRELKLGLMGLILIIVMCSSQILLAVYIGLVFLNYSTIATNVLQIMLNWEMVFSFINPWLMLTFSTAFRTKFIKFIGIKTNHGHSSRINPQPNPA